MPNKLLGLRKSIKKTQKEFADLIGVSQPTYSKKEKSNNDKFSKSEMQIILDYLKDFFPGITAEDVFF